MLADDESDNHSVERQCLAEDEHNQHRDKELVLIFGSTDIASRTVVLRIRHSRVPTSLRLVGKERNLTRAVADSPNAVVTNDTDANARRHAAKAATEARAEMRHARKYAVGIVLLRGWHRDRLTEDDADDETVDANYTGHDNRDDILHDRGWVADARVHDAAARLPGSDLEAWGEREGRSLTSERARTTSHCAVPRGPHE